MKLINVFGNEINIDDIHILARYVGLMGGVEEAGIIIGDDPHKEGARRIPSKSMTEVIKEIANQI